MMPPDSNFAVASDPVDDLIYRISHDLRASTRAIAELPTWIAEDLNEAGIELPASPAEALELLQIHAYRLDEMIQGLLVHSRAGRSDARPVNLVHGVTNALQLVTLPQGTRVRIRCAQVNVMATEKDLVDAVGHLIANAANHHQGTARIAVLGRVEDTWAELWVRDDGPGIPLKKRSSVLRPMVKLRSRDESPGPGMGLAITDKIARGHGGTLDIFDCPRGRTGTAIRLRFPKAG